MAAPGRAPSLPPGRFHLHNGRMPAAFAKWLEKLRTPTAISLALGLVAGLLVIGLRSAGVLQFVELATYDIYLRAKERKSVPEPRVVLVQAFEPDIQKLAEWPLSDRNMAAVLNKLLAYEPRVVGVDLYRDIPVPPGHEDLVSLLKRDKRIVFIEKFGKDSSKRVAGPPALRGTEQIGFADITVDQDGVVRRGLLFLDDGKNFSLSLSLRLALAYLAEKGITPQPGSDDPTHMRLGSVTLKPFEANDGPYVHADAQGYQYMLDYRGGADRFKTYSISDVLEGRVDPRLIKDNVVIVGVNAESVKDEFLTPFDRFTRRGQTTAGIAVHGYEVSQLIRAALDGDAPIGFLADRYENLWILLWAVAGALVGRVARSTMRFTLAAASGLLLLVGATLLAFFAHWWLPVAPVAIAWVTSAALVTAFLSGHERQEKRFLMDIFSKSVSAEVADEMWKQRASFLKGGRLEPQMMTVTVLFSDLANFTPVAERLTPTELMDWLNHYMETMAGLVIKHGGVVDDYFGDAIKSNFGVPLPRKKPEEIRQDAMNAVRCALAMRRAMEELNASWSAENAPRVKMRAGIATGSVVAGCLGSAQRMKYTTIGDVVNTAARLESYGKEIPEQLIDPYCQIMLAASTVEHLEGDFNLQPVGSLQLKGKSQAVDVFALIGSPAETRVELPREPAAPRQAAAR
ncbi:MAG: adenylate/guanylate cyclase domain-containing protein [Betaproteobacteria bacterium]|nr:adenylate/guanylate cyclase domain-containing protein [Betaproteobacteria bacterium]